ncbi:hypothetical protein B0H16DRAFT_1748092 [Mycena metata]|uniref:Uncharacterized protein n=1 Tax=Mycena metata TaxID=1033252 RepID=A0AAD7DYS3_9AGAR|nr:hypothetical protein B0H16DRAFT_1748092 [Mycena metata]
MHEWRGLRDEYLHLLLEVEERYAQGAVAYGLKQAVMYRDIAARATVTMTEVRQGRGKGRTAAVVVVEEGTAPVEGEEGPEDDEDSGDDSDEDLFGGHSDEEAVMGGEGEDD